MLRVLFGAALLLGIACLTIWLIVEVLLPTLLAVAIVAGAIFCTTFLVKSILESVRKPTPQRSTGKHRESKPKGPKEYNGAHANPQHEFQNGQGSRGTTNSGGKEQKHSWRGEREKSWSFGGSYYELLGVEASATADEIRKAWRGIDSGQELSIEARKSFFEAYRVLIDPEARRRYDVELERTRHEKSPNQCHEKRRGKKQERERRNHHSEEGSKNHKDFRSEGHPGIAQPARTFYEQLGVEPSATQSEVVKAWKIFAKKWHPDVCDHPEAKEIFQAGTEAKEVLCDPVNRRKYDAQLSRDRSTTRRPSQARYRSPRQDEQRSENRHSKNGTQKRSRRGGGYSRGQNTRSRTDSNPNTGRSHSSTNYRGPYFTGTWAKIRRGPMRGSWGVWIESLYVREGDYAVIRRLDGRETMVVIVAVLNRSAGNRVSLCVVKNT